MNPPFSVMANVSGCVADAAYRHIASALAWLAPGGRLVTITGANFSPKLPAWLDSFLRLQERGHVVFTAAIAGSVYAGQRVVPCARRDAPIHRRGPRFGLREGDRPTSRPAGQWRRPTIFRRGLRAAFHREAK